MFLIRSCIFLHSRLYKAYSQTLSYLASSSQQSCEVGKVCIIFTGEKTGGTEKPGELSKSTEYLATEAELEFQSPDTQSGAICTKGYCLHHSQRKNTKDLGLAGSAGQGWKIQSIGEEMQQQELCTSQQERADPFKDRAFEGLIFCN